MKFDDIWDVLGGIIIVALATTLVTHKETAKNVTALGKAFSSSIQAALGK